MSKAPPIPREQRSFRGRRPDLAGRDPRRDAENGLQLGHPGEPDVNVRTQGRQANIRQNPMPHRRVLER